MDSRKENLLVLGGAGFIGSQIAKFFFDNGWNVTIIDGILPYTGGRLKNVESFASKIRFIEKDICEMNNLSELINDSDLVVDSMGWTAHRLALENPMYDLRLNLESHIIFFNAIKPEYTGQIIYLGSRGQYGNPSTNIITEDTAMVPEDVQGIHKTAADQHLKIKMKFSHCNAISLRLPNCFGENQPINGDDIGLIGSFIRDSMQGKVIEVFGDERKRNVLYVKDIARGIMNLYTCRKPGFRAYNFAGESINISKLAETVCSLTGQGSVIKKELPNEIKVIDIGNAFFSDKLYQNEIGKLKLTELSEALRRTITYFEGEQNDLEM